jgi:hypothetical protein
VCVQHQVCTNTVTADAWPKDEDSPTTVQLLPSNLSTHALQCDGVIAPDVEGHLA